MAASAPTAPPSGHPESHAQTQAAAWAVRARLARLTALTCIGLTLATALVAVWGRSLMTAQIERSYAEVQTQMSAVQAERIARLLEQELAAGLSSAVVLEQLQESLSRSAYDPTGFMCLLDARDGVLCHPDAGEIGRVVAFDEPAGRTWSGAERLSVPGKSGGTQLVVRRPVPGTTWQVAVHADLDALRERVRRLRDDATKAALPLLLGFIVLGTFAVRLAGRSYERKIEAANRELERKVAARTAELAAASEYYRQVVDTAPSAIFICDDRGRIRQINEQAANLVCASTAGLLGRAIDEVLRWKERPGLAPGGERGAGTADYREAELIPAPGCPVRQLQVFARTLPRADGAQTLLIAQDVTELRRLEQEFIQAQKMEAVGQLAAGVAHDFNNLLAAIMGFTELARIHATRPEQQAHFAQILAACQRAARMTGQMLAFSRKQNLDPRTVRLDAAVDESLRVVERILGEAVVLETCHAPGLWAVRVDPTQFEQVLLNLAINARDAMGGRGRLMVRTRNAAAGTERAGGGVCLLTDYVCIEVEDTGPGVPPGLQAKIFEPFFTTKERGRGTGLGLASVMGIVQQHGGHIELHSPPGCGACFALYFPRAAEADGSAGASEAVVVPGRGRRLLVVEDEPALLDALVARLRAAGYACHGAGQRVAALRWLADGAPCDLVLSDVVMPGPDLGEFLARVRQLAPDVPVVLMTGYASSEALQQAKASGAPLVQKPFTTGALTALIDRLVAPSLASA